MVTFVHTRKFSSFDILSFSSGKGYLLAFQRLLNDSCEPEHWYIQRTVKENTIYLVLSVSCYQSSAK